MKTRNKLLTILAAMVFAFGVVTLAACNDVEHEHTYGAWEIVEDPTESETGKAVRKCSQDDATEELVLNVLTDTEFWTVSTTPATHAAAGATVYTAKSHAGVVYSVTVPALAEHTFGAWTVDPDNEPTESSGGKFVRTCTVDDGASESKDVPALSDNTFWTLSTTPADHENDGSKVYTCEYGTVTVVIPAEGHSYGVWTIDPDNMPTKVLPGKAIRECTGNDGASISKDIPALSDASVWRLKSSIPADHENDGSEVYVSEYGTVTAVIHSQGHNYGDWVIETEPTTTTVGKIVRTCSDDGETDERELPVLGDTSFWDSEVIPQSYNSAEITVYTAKDDDTITVNVVEKPKLVSPYDNKTYFPIGVTTKLKDSTTHSEMTIGVSWTSAKLELDANGEASSTSYPFQGSNKFVMIDAETGAFKWVNVDRDTTKEYFGFVDADSGIAVVQSTSGSYDSVYVLSCYANTDTDVVASDWLVGSDRIAAIEYTYTVDSVENKLGILIVNGEVTLGVSFKDINGAAVAANNCHTAAQVYAYKGSEKIDDFAYGYNGDKMCVLDGNEGTYSADGYEAFVISGFGTAMLGDEAGSYTVSADGKLNVIIGYEVTGNDFYMLTLDKQNKTCSVAEPKVTVRYNVNGGNEIPDGQFTPYVNGELPTPTNSDDTKLFKGWYYDGEFNEKVTEFVPELSDNGYTLYARWGVKITVGIHSDIEYDNYETSLEITTGDVYTDMLPDLGGVYFNGYKFVDWYVDADCTIALPEGAEANDADDGELTLYAKWEIAGIWKLENSGSYGFVFDSAKGVWKSTNQGIKSSSSIMELTVVEGTLNVSFEYAASSEGGNYDIIQIFYYEKANGTSTKVGSDGSKTAYESLVWQTYNTDLVVGNKIQFNYKKDSSGDHIDDTGYVRNLVINGMRVTTLGSVDFLDGTYTCTGKDDLVLDGAGGFTWGDKSGTYAKQSGSDSFDMYVVDGGKSVEYYALDLDTDNMTYTVEKTMVTLTLDYGITGEARENSEVNKNIAQTLVEKNVSGFVLRGWYDNAEFTGGVKTTVTLTDDTVYYAKYDRAITLIYNHMVAGTADRQENKFENDKIGTLYEMPDSVTNGEKLFVGWFTEDGTDGDWGEQVTKDTVVTGASESSAVMTVYAQWVAPHVLTGTYYYANLDPAESGIVKETDTFSATNSSNLTIDVVGKATGWKTGTIEEYDAETGKFALNVNGTKYYGGSDAVNGFVYIDYASGKTTPYHDIGFLVKAVDGLYAVSSIDIAWDKGCTKLVQITYNGDNSPVKYLLIYNRVVYGDVTWTATDTDGTAITDFAKLAAEVANLTVKKGQSTIGEFAKMNNNLAKVDGTQGTYTCEGKEDIVLNGAGGITYDGKTGTLTATDDGYIARFADAAYILTVDTTAKTYTLVDDKITVSFDFGTLNASLESTDVYRDIAFTLPAAPEINGYIFRGWYENAEYTGSTLTKVTPDDDMTVYAKYDKAITVTVVYGNGMETVTITDKFAGDTVTVALPDSANGLYAVGWYTDAEFTSAWTSGSDVADDITIYCKWSEPSPLMGSYLTYEVWNNTNASSRSVLTVDVFASFSGLFSGSLDVYDEATGYGAVKNGSNYRYLYFDKGLKAFVANYGNTNGTFTNDVYIGIQATSFTIAASDCITLDGSNVTRLIKYTADDDVGYILVGKDVVVFAKSVAVKDKDGNAVEAWSNYKTAGNVFTFTRNDDTTVVASYDGTKLLISDGVSGTYANSVLFGDLAFDGYGNLAIGNGEVSYALNDEGNVRFVYGNRMYIVSLDKTNSTYAQVQDGYAGTYTLPDGAGTVTFDGLGGADGGKTYVVSGAQVTVYDGDTSTKYGLDVENKALLGKSVFAGLTFTGSYYDNSHDRNDLTIIFDDSTEITGVMYAGYGTMFYFNFTGELDGNTLTLTITKAIDSGAVSKTVVFSISGDTMTVTSNGISNGAYTFQNDGSVSCEGFSL